MLDSLIGLLAPHSCLGCGRDGALVCRDCIPTLPERRRPSCFRCNRFTSRFQVCPRCRALVSLEGVVVAAHYRGGVKALISRLKFDHAWAAGRIGATLIATLLDPDDFDLVTAVPTASRRYRTRGYNQAALIGKPLAKQLGLPYQPLLLRSGQARQVGLDRTSRLAQLKGSMLAFNPAAIQDQRVLVIDDVLTTGASLDEAARALKRAGAKSVWGAVVAKH